LDSYSTMPEQLDIPDGASRLDAQRIKQVNRNLQIRAAYDKLVDKYGRDEALRRLGDLHNLEPRTVRAIVYGQR